MSLDKWLTAAPTAAKSKPMFCFHGAADVGKTTLAAQFEGVAFARVGDVGVRELQRWGRLPNTIISTEEFHSYKQYEQFLDDLVASKSRPKALCVDGLGGVQEILFNQIRDDDYDGSTSKFQAFGGVGPKSAVSKFQTMLDKLGLLLDTTTVILLCHSDNIQMPNPTGQSYMAAGPNLDKNLLKILVQEVPNIGYVYQKPDVVEDGLKKKAKNVRPQSILQFVGTPAVVAKNKIGITEVIPLGETPKEGFDNLMTVIKNAVEENKQ